MPKKSKYEGIYKAGDTFNHWTVVSGEVEKTNLRENGYGDAGLNVRCMCGVERIVTIHNLKTDKSLSCGCHYYQRGSSNPNWKGTESIPGRYIARIESSAEKRGISYSLTGPLMQNQLVAQNFSCSLSGKPLIFGSSNTETNTNASLDRIDSTKGYVSGNIQWVTKEVNMAKQQMEQQEFIQMCVKVAEKFNETKTD